LNKRRETTVVARAVADVEANVRVTKQLAAIAGKIRFFMMFKLTLLFLFFIV